MQLCEVYVLQSSIDRLYCHLYALPAKKFIRNKCNCIQQNINTLTCYPKKKNRRRLRKYEFSPESFPWVFGLGAIPRAPNQIYYKLDASTSSLGFFSTGIIVAFMRMFSSQFPHLLLFFHINDRLFEREQLRELNMHVLMMTDFFEQMFTIFCVDKHRTLAECRYILSVLSIQILFLTV